jgi:hypothetical protein
MDKVVENSPVGEWSLRFVLFFEMCELLFSDLTVVNLHCHCLLATYPHISLFVLLA